MAALSSTVLYEHRPKSGRFLVGVVAFGCILVGVALGLPLLIGTPPDPAVSDLIALSWLLGLGLPPVGVAGWLLTPAISTAYDASRGVLALEYRRPLGRWIKEFRVDEIADIRPLRMSKGRCALGMWLKSGQFVQLAYGSKSDAPEIQQAAARIKAAVGLEDLL
jgi:hypothetical protein